MENTTEGYCVGEICNRGDCKGVIKQHDSDYGCSCHINPPCSFCETPREYCDECDWDAHEEQLQILDSYKPTQDQLDKWAADRKKAEEADAYFRNLMNGTEAITEFTYRKKSHTHFSMLVEGVYTPEMTSQQVYEKVKGTFGGRFKRFNNGRFEFVAYTD